MKYPKSEKYNTPALQEKIMGPSPVKLAEELLDDNCIPDGAVVCDLGSGQGLTSVFLAKEYGFTVYAADLWSDPEENRKFFDAMGLERLRIIPVKADAEDLPFEKEFFEFLNTKYPEIPNAIAEEKVISEETEGKLKKAIEEFKQVFVK